MLPSAEAVSYTHLDVYKRQCIHRPVSNSERLIIINAGGEMGCIPNCLLMWKAGRKSGDYHD